MGSRKELLKMYELKKLLSDAYTKRIVLRHGILGDDADYHAIQALFMDHLQPDVSLFNQFHAMSVNTGKIFCRKAPQCAGCPLSVLQAGKKPSSRRKASHSCI
jgi:endonuclease-3 related protein